MAWEAVETNMLLVQWVPLGTHLAHRSVAQPYQRHTQAEQGHGVDCLQRPLVPRSRFQQQLMPGVSCSENSRHQLWTYLSSRL